MPRDDFMASHGARLLARGYDLTSIKHGLKHPGRSGWQNDAVGLRHDLEREEHGRMTSAARVDIWSCDPKITGVGVICNTVIAVDIDVTDDLMADYLVSLIETQFGRTVRRIGNAPKILLPYKVSAPISRSKSRHYRDPDNRRFNSNGREVFHHVDFWGSGSQFVAYGWHPDTNRPYYYDGPELADVDRDSLPELTPADIAAISALFDDACSKAGWEAVDQATANNLTVIDTANADPFDAIMPKHGADLDELETMLRQIDPDLPGKEYDQVIKAAHFEFDGSQAAFDVVRQWAEGGYKWENGGIAEFKTRWRRAGQGAPAGSKPVRLATLQDWINRGLWRSADADTPPDLAATLTPEPNRRGLQIELEHDFVTKELAHDWLIDGVLTAGEPSMLFADPGSFKSFIALDIAYHVAAGREWHGRAVKQGSVVYIAGEGRHGLRARGAAWRTFHGLDDAVPLGITNGPIHLNNKDAINAAVPVLDGFIEAHGDLALIIVDTVARNNLGDENSNTDINTLMAYVDAIMRRYRCAVLLVHHTGTKDKDRARGGSAFLGALDSQYRLDKLDGDGFVVCMRNTKMKDASDGFAVWFEGHTVEIGDRDGTPQSSLAFSETAARAGEVAGDITDPAAGLKGQQAALYAIIASEGPVDRETVREIIKADVEGGVDGPWKADASDRSAQIRTAIKALTDKSLIVETASRKLDTVENVEILTGFENDEF